jgi:hypothetical protein
VAEESLDNSFFTTKAHASIKTENDKYRLTHMLKMNVVDSHYYSELKHEMYNSGQSATVSFGNSRFRSSFTKRDEDNRKEERVSVSGKYEEWNFSGSYGEVNGNKTQAFEAGKKEDLNRIGETLNRSFSITENEFGEPEYRFKMELKHF